MSDEAQRLGKAPRALAAFNIFASAVGGSLVALPSIFQRIGLLTAGCTMLASGFTVVLSILALVELSVRTDAKSYGDMTSAVFGKFAAVVVEILIIIMAMGVICSMCIVLRDVTETILLNSNVPSEPWTPLITAGFVEFVTLPLSLPTSIDNLVYGAFFSILAFLFLVSVLWVDGIRSIPLWYPNDTDSVLFTIHPTLADIGTAAPVIVLALACQLQIMSVVQEQVPRKHQSVRGFLPVAIGAVVAMSFVFLSCGTFGVLNAPPSINGTPANISSDVTKDLEGVSGTIARVGLGCAVMLVAPLALFPTRQAAMSLARKCGLKLTKYELQQYRNRHVIAEVFDEEEGTSVGKEEPAKSSTLDDGAVRVLEPVKIDDGGVLEHPVPPGQIVTLKAMTCQGRIAHVGMTIAICQLALGVAIGGSDILFVFRILGGGLACPLFLILPGVAVWRLRALQASNVDCDSDPGHAPLSPLLGPQRPGGDTAFAVNGAEMLSPTSAQDSTEPVDQRSMSRCFAFGAVAWLIVYGAFVSALSLWSLAMGY